MANRTWTVTNKQYDAHTLGQWNSVATVSNGYLGLKGNLAEQRGGYSPVTLINGVYDELDMFSLIRASNEERRYLDPRYFGTAGRSPAVANLPNPLFVQVFVDEREISLSRGGISGFEQMLDLATGVYRYRFDYRDDGGRTTRIEMQRFASLVHPHRVFMRYAVTPVDHSAPLRIHSGISGQVHSNTTRERQFEVTELWTDPAERCRMVAHTPARGHEVRIGVANMLTPPPLRGRPGGGDTATLPRPLPEREGSQNAGHGGPAQLSGGHGGPALQVAGVAEHDAVYTRYVLNSPLAGQTITIERAIVLTCSEDLRHGVVADLEAELDAAVRQGFDAALATQRAAWQKLWERCDVQIDGDDDAQRHLRLCLYHLLAAAPRFTDKLSVPVKLLTGDYYQGNTFYDTDVYILPFYTFTLPDLARTCLNYRWEGLRPGRDIARQLGYSGAKFAWQAGPYGEECLGRWYRFTHTNIHINADVAYALMQYWAATGDGRYLAERGIDILVETARFYASRAVYDAASDRYHLHDVAGPDEGHCESTDNFYTNYLAIRNLRWAADVVERVERDDPQAHAAAVQRLALRADEPPKWRRVAERLALLFDPQTKVYEQCAGFYQLKPIPPDLLINRKVWFVTVAPYQALNQPDVVMALVMFRDEFPPDVQRANWEFYKDKSMDFSSMSFVLNAIMAADMGEMEDAYEDFVISAGEDLDEELTGRKDTYAGLHGTAAGGAWMAAVFGFGGVCLSERGLRINPSLPSKWTGLRFNLVLRGVVVNVAIDREQVVLRAGTERPVELPVEIGGQKYTLRGGQRCTVRYGGDRVTKR